MSGARKLAAAGLAILGVRLALLAGTGAAVGNWVTELSKSGKLISASINLELGPRDGQSEPTPGPDETPFAEALPVSATAAPTPEAPAEGTPSPEDGTDIVETTIYGGLAIKNTTSYDIGIDDLMSEGLSVKLPSEGPQILIIHTHSSEAYTPGGQDKYTPSDPSRTEDTRYNVIRVGDELAAALESFGLNVLHDRGVYDYPSYTGCYSRSGAAVQEYLKEYPDIAVVIDLHRDALGNGDVVYKTMAEVDGECSSQVMLLCGTDDSGLEHPNWRENLKLALYMQQAVNQKYPTLARPVSVVPERYNQNMCTGSLLLEVGSSGNTLQEALCAVRLFADAVGPALSELVAAD